MKSFRKVLLVIRPVLSILIISPFLFYVLFGAALYFFQRTLLYIPDSQDFENCPGFIDYQAKTYQSTRFYYKPGGNERIIVHYHGNAGSACDRSVHKEIFESAGTSVLFVEYAGYSNDTVTPSRDRILQNVRDTHTFVQDRYSHVVVYGQSLGAAAASYHAALGSVDRLILVSPFTRIRDIARHVYPIYPVDLLLREEFDNVAWLQEYTGELTIYYATLDTTIPALFSQQLFTYAGSDRKTLIAIENTNHNTLWASQEFQKHVWKTLNN